LTVRCSALLAAFTFKVTHPLRVLHLLEISVPVRFLYHESIGSDSIDLYRFRPNLSLEAAIEDQQASDKAKSIESDPIDLFIDLGST
jgi:hypothetical protein